MIKNPILLINERIKMTVHIILDVDGVLTDNTVLVTENGELLRKMTVRDGQAIKIAMAKGLHFAIITKGASKGVRDRLSALGIEDIYDRLSEKSDAFEDMVRKYKWHKDELLYMGDDIPDLVLKDKVSIFACPNDAIPEVLEVADYISPFKGGNGCVREVIERTLKIQKKWITPLNEPS